MLAPSAPLTVIVLPSYGDPDGTVLIDPAVDIALTTTNPWSRHRAPEQAFAERARVELRASGEHARKRTVETLDQLTPQESQIARLAAKGKNQSRDSYPTSSHGHSLGNEFAAVRK